MNQEKPKQNQLEKEPNNDRLKKLKRLGLVVILAAVLTTGVSECRQLSYPINEENVIHDNFRPNKDTGEMEFIEGTYDSPSLPNSLDDTATTPNQ